MDLLKKSVNSLTVLGLYAGTPIDSDNLHQSIGGLSNENIEASMFSLDNPPIDWCKLSESMGVPAYNPKTVKEFTDFFNKSINEPGPSLIELNV